MEKKVWRRLAFEVVQRSLATKFQIIDHNIIQLTFPNNQYHVSQSTTVYLMTAENHCPFIHLRGGGVKGGTRVASKYFPCGRVLFFTS